MTVNQGWMASVVVPAIGSSNTLMPRTASAPARFAVSVDHECDIEICRGRDGRHVMATPTAALASVSAVRAPWRA